MKKFLLGILVVCSVSIIATSCSKDEDSCYSCTGDGGLLTDVSSICEGDVTLTTTNMSIEVWVDNYETAGGTCTKK